MQLVCRSYQVAEAAHRLSLLDLYVLLRRHDVVTVGSGSVFVMRRGDEVVFSSSVLVLSGQSVGVVVGVDFTHAIAPFDESARLGRGHCSDVLIGNSQTNVFLLSTAVLQITLTQQLGRVKLVLGFVCPVVVLIDFEGFATEDLPRGFGADHG